MRVVIDASIDPRLVEAFPDHQVQTLFDLGWQHLKDHVLVKRLACDAFVTADRGFEHEHDRPLFPQLLKAVAEIKAGSVVHVYGAPVD